MLLNMAAGCVEPREVFLHCENYDNNYGLIVSCHRRFKVQCPECSKRWKRRKIGQIKESIEAMRSPKFVTLTLKRHNGTSGNLNRIWEYRRALFIRLRKSGYHIFSWIGVVELPNHVHIVMDCPDYIPQPFMSQSWRTVTGDSYIVDIRHVYDRERIGWYVAKYLGKGLNSLDYEPELLKGFHIVQSWNIVKLKRSKFVCPVCKLVHDIIVISDEEFWHDPDRMFTE